MPKLTVFYLEHCPYCHSARRAAEALKSEDGRYGEIELDWIEESRAPERTQGYDYYYVPSIFLDHEKLYECSPAHGDAEILANVRSAFDRAQGD